MITRPLSHADSLRVLLTGTCGANVRLIADEAKLSRMTVKGFLRGDGDGPLRPATLEALGWFVWRRMNATVLLGEEDRAP